MAFPDLSRKALSKLKCVERSTVNYSQAMLHLRNLQVDRVWKVVNDMLDMQYARAVSAAAKEYEVKVLHGTTEECVQLIVQHGFKVGGVDVPAKNGSSHGKGIFLTTDAHVAVPYCSRDRENMYIIVADLCVTAACKKCGRRYPSFTGTNEVFEMYEQPDKSLVRPLYVCQVRQSSTNIQGRVGVVGGINKYTPLLSTIRLQKRRPNWHPPLVWKSGNPPSRAAMAEVIQNFLNEEDVGRNGSNLTAPFIVLSSRLAASSATDGAVQDPHPASLLPPPQPHLSQMMSDASQQSSASLTTAVPIELPPSVSNGAPQLPLLTPLIPPLLSVPPASASNDRQ